MAAGCALVASDTAPVQEVLEDGVSALLVDFFDPVAQAKALNRMLDEPALRLALARSAQQKSREYTSSSGLRKWGGVLGLELST